MLEAEKGSVAYQLLAELRRLEDRIKVLEGQVAVLLESPRRNQAVHEPIASKQATHRKG
jgi:hypothetical protein